MFLGSDLPPQIQKILNILKPVDNACLTLVEKVLGLLYQYYYIVTRLIYIAIIFIIVKKKVKPFIDQFIYDSSTTRPNVEKAIEPTTTKTLKTDRLIALCIIAGVAVFVLAVLVGII